MIYDPNEKDSLSTYIENLQSQGRYSFTKTEASEVLGCKEEAFERAVSRLTRKKRLLTIKPGFYIIVPIEYKVWGNLPPEWFIKDLMAYLKLPYYVGLLTAAAVYGAAHQQPQQYQVMTSIALRRIYKRRLNIVFLKNQYIQKIPTIERQTQTGHILVSTPEATALDLVRFYKRAGYLSNVATVLSELKEHLKPEVLIKNSKEIAYEWPVIQRLGYLLSREEVGGEELAKPLAEWIAEEQPRFVPLAPYNKYNEYNRDERWKIFINEIIEVDV